MNDLLELAARLEAACDITGKPTGRHMVPGMTKLAEMQVAMGANEDDREAGELGGVTSCLTACIDNEAKLFDALVVVAKEAAGALRASARSSDGAADPEVFEAMIWDAHLPSMSARFRIPPGLPFASGMYEIRRVRRPTEEDMARWDHLPEPPEVGNI